MRATGTRRARRAPPVQPDSADAAYAAALKRLVAQPQSRAMLARKLLRAGYTEPAVEAALDRAAGQRYLDDQAFARALVRRRSLGRGRAMIAQELRARGIDATGASEALQQLDPGTELERARALADEIVRRKPPADWRQLRTTVGGRLGRRGFSAGVITRILRELVAKEAGPAAADVVRFDTPLEPD